jgi:hypothetical protein
VGVVGPVGGTKVDRHDVLANRDAVVRIGGGEVVTWLCCVLDRLTRFCCSR